MMPRLTLIAVCVVGIFMLPEISYAGWFGKGDVNSFYRTHPRAKKFKVATKEIHRKTTTHYATSFGKTYQYYKTVITYKDIYSDGTTRIWRSTW